MERLVPSPWLPPEVDSLRCTFTFEPQGQIWSGGWISSNTMITFTHYIIYNIMTWKDIHTERKISICSLPYSKDVHLLFFVFFYRFLIHIIKILADRLAHTSDSERLRCYIQSVSWVTERKRQMSWLPDFVIWLQGFAYFGDLPMREMGHSWMLFRFNSVDRISLGFLLLSLCPYIKSQDSWACLSILSLVS